MISAILCSDIIFIKFLLLRSNKIKRVNFITNSVQFLICIRTLIGSVKKNNK